jgi:hypothetical protein
MEGMMKISARFVPGYLAVAAALAAMAIASPPVAGKQASEKFTGFAINMNSGPSTATVDFTIDKWSPESDRDTLLSILQEEKDSYRANDKMLKVLQKMPKVGYIRTPDRLAWDLRYARQSPLPDGGRRIVLATDRPVGFREAANNPRTMDYPFTIIEVQLNKSDEGVGKILAGTRLYIDKKSKELVLENYGQQPIRFNEIRRLK